MGLWGLVAGGELIRLLSGATVDDLSKLTKSVTGVEDWQGPTDTATDLEQLTQRIRAIEQQQGQVAISTDLATLAERVRAVEESQEQVAMATDLSTLTKRIVAVETRQDELAHHRFTPIRPIDTKPEERTFGEEKGWGAWGAAVHCEAHQYVCGLMQRVESSQGKGDDTGMNDIKFYCCSFPEFVSTQSVAQ